MGEAATQALAAPQRLPEPSGYWLAGRQHLAVNYSAVSRVELLGPPHALQHGGGGHSGGG